MKHFGRASRVVAMTAACACLMALTDAVRADDGAASGPRLNETAEIAESSSTADASTPPPPPTVPARKAVNDLRPRALGQAKPSVGSIGQSSTANASGGAGDSATSALMSNSTLRTTISLGVVLGIIMGCALLLKKLRAKGILVGGSIAAGARAPSGVMEILGRYPLARGQTLLLVKLDQRVLLIGQTTGTLRAGGGSLSTLCEITDPEDVASLLVKTQDAADASAAAKFQQMIHEFDDRHAQHEPMVETAASVNLRNTRTSSGGDRVETWNDRADARSIPMIPHTQPMADRRGVQSEGNSGGQSRQTESYGSLRDRLTALRGEAHR